MLSHGLYMSLGTPIAMSYIKLFYLLKKKIEFLPLKKRRAYKRTKIGYTALHCPLLLMKYLFE